MSTRKINWREWTPETLKSAEREDKPILLAITATWCHWCHVMDRDTFGVDEVAAYVNAYFVPIRADNDRRPDLNARYNMGGWPSVAFLLPNGEILTGTTYLPANQMLELLIRVARVFAEEREGLASRAEDVTRQQELSAGASTSSGLLTEQIPGSILRGIEAIFDPIHGGFGAQPKFPHVSAIELLLVSYRRTGNARYLDMATKTLDEMANGGMYDHEEGGFFRYSTTHEWSVPHYEKMLADNAGLLGVYVLAYSLTSEARFLDTARDVTLYLESTLFDQSAGAFYGSQDADEDYYKLPMSERRSRNAPSVDKAIYTDWNGIVADAYLRTYEATGDKAYLGRALKVIEFLTLYCRHERLFYHYYEDEPRHAGILSDQVWTGTAILRAYECTSDRSYLNLARELADGMVESFVDAEGGFFDVSATRQAAEMLPQREKPLVENACAASFLNRLAYYSHHSPYRALAESALRSMVSIYASHGLIAAPYALAVTEVLEEPVRIAISGDKNDPRTQALLDASFRLKSPSSLVQLLQEPEDSAEIRALGISATTHPRAAVCAGPNCRITGSSTELDEAIRDVEGRVV